MSGTYAQINYNPDDLEDVSVTEVQRQEAVPVESMDTSEAAAANDAECAEESLAEAYPLEEEKSLEQELELENLAAELAEDAKKETKNTAEPTVGEVTEEVPKEPSEGETSIEEETPVEETAVPTPETEEPEQQETASEPEEVPTGEPCDEKAANTVLVPEEVQILLKQYAEANEDIQRTLRRLEKKFADEILNGENRDSSVKTMYKELNEYKAGIVEKALKTVLYDIVDIRETMLSQIRFLREKKGAESISLDEFESYADDIGDILEKHDVTIYKGNVGEENVAVRQKIVRKVETEDDSMVKMVAESLSYGYEYGSKILYPEKISVYVKKK